MTIDVKYGIGDRVGYATTITNYSEMVACTFCDGSGRISGYDGSIMECPKCLGTGQVRKMNAIQGDSKVKNVRVSYNALSDREPSIVYELENGLFVKQDDVNYVFLDEKGESGL